MKYFATGISRAIRTEFYGSLKKNTHSHDKRMKVISKKKNKRSRLILIYIYSERMIQ